MMNSTDYTSFNISDIGNDTIDQLSDYEEYQLNKSEFIVAHLGIQHQVISHFSTKKDQLNINLN